MIRIFSALLIAAITFPSISDAAHINSSKRFSDWVYSQRQYLNNDFSCQAYQCASGLCENKRSFLFNASRDGWIAGPQFNHNFRYPPGTKVKLVIGSKTFVMINNRDKNNKFFLAVDGRQAIEINRLLLKLSKSNGSKKFYVVDTKGRKNSFSARGIAPLFSHIKERCDVPLP